MPLFGYIVFRYGIYQHYFSAIDFVAIYFRFVNGTSTQFNRHFLKSPPTQMAIPKLKLKWPFPAVLKLSVHYCINMLINIRVVKYISCLTADTKSMAVASDNRIIYLLFYRHEENGGGIRQQNNIPLVLQARREWRWHQTTE